MKILSIDTSSNICTVALLEDNKLIKEKVENDLKTHSEVLLPLLSELFQEVNYTIQDIDLIVCDKGPGSFTGIRIGVATAIAFSDCLGKKAIGISSLEALAYNVKEDGFICSLIDAKNGNVYFGLYELLDGKYTLLQDLHLDSIENIIKTAIPKDKSVTFVGDGAVVYKSLIENAMPHSIFVDNNDLSSYSLGIAGYNCFLSGTTQDVMPLYLRKSQAERVIEEKIIEAK